MEINEQKDADEVKGFSEFQGFSEKREKERQTRAKREYCMYNCDEEHVSIGKWILVFIISIIPFLNFIMFVVWAVSDKTKKSLQNYAKACLILMCIGLILSLITMVACYYAYL